MTTSPGETAFPCGRDTSDTDSGLTKREYFAAMAMQGLMPSEVSFPVSESAAKVIAAIAVQQADALIAALNGDS
jgi:hypothetical protein